MPIYTADHSWNLFESKLSVFKTIPRHWNWKKCCSYFPFVNIIATLEGAPFKGFLIQARVVASNTIVGSFTSVPAMYVDRSFVNILCFPSTLGAM